VEAESAPRGRPRAEPFAVQRARVVAAARRLFAAQGYDATTVAEVARHADVPRAVAYETVGDKQALLAAVTEQVAEELVAGFVSQVDRADRPDVAAPEVVRASVSWFLRLMRDDPSIAAIVRLSALLPDEPAHAVQRARRAFEDRLTEIHLARSAGSDAAREASARLLAVMVVAAAESVALRAAVDHWPGDEAAAVVAEALVGVYDRVQESPEGVDAVVSFNRAMADGDRP
jgi:AcrR family transcriptional regulator